MLRVLSIIPARSGSKSLPNKNVLFFRGMPLLGHSIKYSKSSDLVSKTIVSTDSTEIAEIAENLGAEVPFLRPTELAKDESQDYEFTRHALDYFEKNGDIFDIYIILRPTSPLRPKGLIERAVEIFQITPEITSVRSVTEIKEHPYRSWKMNKDGSISGYESAVHEAYNLPRQKLPKIFFQTGDLEAVSRRTVLAGSVSGNKVFPLFISYSDMQDIDTLEDFERASYKT